MRLKHVFLTAFFGSIGGCHLEMVNEPILVTPSVSLEDVMIQESVDELTIDMIGFTNENYEFTLDTELWTLMGHRDIPVYEVACSSLKVLSEPTELPAPWVERLWCQQLAADPQALTHQ